MPTRILSKKYSSKQLTNWDDDGEDDDDERRVRWRTTTTLHDPLTFPGALTKHTLLLVNAPFFIVFHFVLFGERMLSRVNEKRAPNVLRKKSDRAQC